MTPEKPELNPMIGQLIKVRLKNGDDLTGTFDIHPLAGECVRNQYGFPINYKEILEIIKD